MSVEFSRVTDIGSCNTLSKKTHNINMATERTLQQDDNNRSISIASFVNICHVTVDLSFPSKFNPMTY